MAEGSGRSTNLDQAHFTNMAYSSGLEVINHLNVANQMRYISQDSYETIRITMGEILNKLNSLYKYQINKKTNLKDQ
ncbi:four helix bundle protein [Myroides sp. JBRI-B21084]|uniref:four helix bundle protein n=1 Tax=Myroides sp. JBRI-B21084 TaxID=3119977 RepID=UPI0026E28E37|nr:four helix bundle protein [Paenimyroides cloacae]WKW45547.1 four helix bundle protein [Paenimyroides cloacae]